MIVLPFMLASARTGRTTCKGTIIIDNIGGTDRARNYRVRAYAAGAERDGITAMIRHKRPFREGTITGHNSPALPVWVLAAKAMDALGYVDSKDNAQQSMFDAFASPEKRP